MSEEIIFERDYAVSKYLPDKNLVMIIWNGSPAHEQYKEVFNMCLDFQENSPKPVYNFLSDVRKQGAVSPESRKWFETVAIPRSVMQGLKRGAVVFDGSVFKKYYLNIILQSTNRFKLPFRFFRSINDAINWLESFED